MLAGEIIRCFGRTEPTAGSDPSSMTKTAIEQADVSWVLTGAKHWIGLASVAQIAVAWVITDQGAKGFQVLADAEGSTATPIEHKYDMRFHPVRHPPVSVRLPADGFLPGTKE